ncbi:MAG: AsmA-like C-terminal region-containing protein [Bacteroidota bacterium]
MRIVFKTLKNLAFTILLIVVMLFSIAEFAEDRIADISINQIDKSLGLPVSYGEVNFSLLHGFPLATLEINDVWLGAPVFDDSTKIRTDTLANLGKIYVSVKIIPLAREQRFEIVKIDLVDTEGFYNVSAKGNSNVDFLVDTTHKEHQEVVDTTTSELKISLKELNIKNLNFNLNDSSQNIMARLSLPEISLNGQFINGVFESAIEGTAVLTNCNFAETNVCLMEQTRFDFDLAYKKDSVFIDGINLVSDGAEAKITGKVGLSDSIYTNLLVESPELNINELIKYIPEETLYEHGLENLGGQLSFNGSIHGYTSDSLMPQMQFSFRLNNGDLKMSGYPPLSEISLEGTYDNGDLCCNQTTTLAINSLNFNTPESRFDLDILINNFSEPDYSARLETELDLNELHRHYSYYIPDSLAKSVSGKLTAQLATEGTLPEEIDSTFVDYIADNSEASLNFENVNLALDSVFSIDSCNFHFDYSQDTLKMKNINFQVPAYNTAIRNASLNTSMKGRLSNLPDLAVNIDSFHIATPQSNISGNLFLSNLHHPDYWLSTSIDANLNELSQMLPDSMITRMSGNINTQIAMKGKVDPDSLTQELESHIFENGKYFATLNNVSLEMPDTLMQVNHLSGNIRMANDTLSVNNMRGQYREIDFGSDSTIVTNIYQTFIRENPLPLNVNGKFALGDIDYSKLAMLMEEPNETDSLNRAQKEEPADTLNSQKKDLEYQVKGTLTVNSIKYNKSTFDDISCLFNLSNNLYIIDNLNFKAFNGSLNNSLRYEIKDGQKSVVSLRSEIDKMDISNLLDEFNNFDQEEISHEQISGLFSTNLNGRFMMIEDSLVMDSTRVKGDMKLENGGLFNYKRAEELAEFTNLDELDNIRFKTLESKIFIFNNAIFVPQTDIKSNSMNITAFGMQTFGEDYQYHLRLYLGEILRGKTKRIRRKQEEMEDNPDDDKSGLRSLFVQASSKDGKSKNGLDKKSDRLQMRTKINVQEGILNIVFHPLLVDFYTGVKLQPLLLNEEHHKKAGVAVNNKN